MHIYSLDENFSSVLTMLPPGAEDHLTKFSTLVMRNPLWSCWSGLTNRLENFTTRGESCLVLETYLLFWPSEIIDLGGDPKTTTSLNQRNP